MDKQKLVVITGPTAVGKTKLSIELAKRIGGEIISADSMQVYKYMNIGTDKISRDKMEGVPHHLIDFLDPDRRHCFKRKGSDHSRRNRFLYSGCPLRHRFYRDR